MTEQRGVNAKQFGCQNLIQGFTTLNYTQDVCLFHNKILSSISSNISYSFIHVKFLVTSSNKAEFGRVTDFNKVSCMQFICFRMIFK